MTRAPLSRASCAAALHGAGGAGDEDGLADAHATFHVVDPDERGQAGHPEHAERRGHARRQVDVLDASTVGLDEHAPAQPVDDPGALGEALVAGCDHLAHGPAVERLPQRNGCTSDDVVDVLLAHVRVTET